MFASLDVNDIIGMGIETVGIQRPEGLDGGLKVSFGSGGVRWWEFKCQWFGSEDEGV
jgi:hypothetical protein